MTALAGVEIWVVAASQLVSSLSSCAVFPEYQELAWLALRVAIRAAGIYEAES